MVGGGECGLTLPDRLLGPRFGRRARSLLSVAAPVGVVWLCIFWDFSFRRLNDGMDGFSSAFMALVTLLVIVVLSMAVVMAMSVGAPSVFGPRLWARVAVAFRVAAMVVVLFSPVALVVLGLRFRFGLTAPSLIDYGVVWGAPIGMAAAIVSGTKHAWRSMDDPQRGCERCGYDLAGSRSDRCPECGERAFAGRGMIEPRPSVQDRSD